MKATTASNLCAGDCLEGKIDNKWIKVTVYNSILKGLEKAGKRKERKQPF